MHIVLIVDDEEGFVQITEAVLRRAGYQTVSASNGDDGLRLVEEVTPDLIILDDMMPGISGMDVCLRLKNDPRHNTVPVIMHTAGTRLRAPDKVRAIGADAILFKPTMPNEILDMVSRLLDKGYS
jgi:DNA-binding response OmpR family regulator